MASILSEFDEVGYKEMIRQEAYEDAYEEVYEKGVEYGVQYGVEYGGVKTLIEFVQDIGYSKEDATTLAKQRFHLSDDVINQYMQKFWKDN